jgi:hypothetical protein
MGGRLWADEQTRRFYEAQQTAVDRARELPAEQARALLGRLARQEAAWRAARRRQRLRSQVRDLGAGVAP